MCRGLAPASFRIPPWHETQRSGSRCERRLDHEWRNGNAERQVRSGEWKSSGAPGSSELISSTACWQITPVEVVRVYDNFSSGREWHLSGPPGRPPTRSDRG